MRRVLIVDNDGNVYVAGVAGTLMVTVKYVQSPLVTTRFVSAAILPDGQFQLTLTGKAGKTCEIQTSADVVDWTTLTNFVSVTGMNQITDSPSSAQRFYRAVKLP